MEREIEAESGPDHEPGEGDRGLEEPTERDRALRAGLLGLALGAVLATLARTTRRR